jgi:hypothetical protein
VAVLRLRPITAAPDDFVEICRDVIPYHCDATTWSLGVLTSGFAVVLAALLSVAFVAGTGWSGIGVWVAAVVAPAVGLVGGVLANRYGVPVLGRLAQSTNVFRLAVLVLPFGAWGLLAGFVRLAGWRRAAWLVPAVAAGYGWFVPRDGNVVLPDDLRRAEIVLGVAAAGVLLRYLPRRVGDVAGGLAGLAAVGLLVVGAADLRVLRPRPVDITFIPDARDRALGRAVAAHVPVGEEVLVPPTLGVVRLASGRSILVDCKAVPYGGPAWQEYRGRLDALGGRDSCHSGGRPFVKVTPERLASTALRYGARYVLLPARDVVRADAAQRLGWRPLMRPESQDRGMWLLAAPGAPDAETWPADGAADRATAAAARPSEG